MTDKSDRFFETGDGLQIIKADPVGPYQVTEAEDGEWWVVDALGNVVGEWDSKAEADEDAREMQESDDAS